MPGAAISVKDEVSPWLANIERFLAERPSRLVIAESAAQEVVANFRALAAERHRPHVAHNFYANAARATTAEATATDGLVIVDHIGIGQRYYGGTLKPVRAKRLTIPAAKEAEGKRAREFKDLFYLKIRRTGTEALARRAGKSLQVMYWLKDEVTQERDPSVLPTDEDLFRAIDAGLEDYMQNRFKR